MSDRMVRARRVLIVEDEILLAMNLQDMLTELGHQVILLATRIEKALPMARDGDIDFAVLDLNVAGKLSFPVADILRGRGIHFIFASGYGAQGLADGYRHELVLTKPFGVSELRRMIAQMPSAPAPLVKSP
jgi:DNA-binding response OmpR family regulator